MDAFLDKIDLAEDALEPDQKETLRKFVLTKLEGKARELVSTTDTLAVIKAALRNNIKHDSSKIIAGRMLSMKLNKIPSADYATKAEELAEALQRSLIAEGISREKATEMSIEKTVEMCRQSASSSVRTILAAAKFENPKEVIAKLVTKQTVNEHEMQVLAFKRYENQRKQNWQNNFRRSQPGNGSYNRYNNNNGNNQQNNGNTSNSSRGNFRQNRGNKRQNYNIRVTENCGSPEDGPYESQFEDQFEEQFDNQMTMDQMDDPNQPEFCLETSETNQ